MGMFDDVLENVGEPYKGGKGFVYGTHDVIIGDVESKSKPTKKVPEGCAVIEVTVIGKEDNTQEATCTLWFHTPGAAKMSVTKVMGLLVHSVGEEKKEAVKTVGKKLFGNIDDPLVARDVAFKLMQEKLITKEAYLVTEPNGKYTTTSYGDLWHYPATPQNPDERAERAATAEKVGGEDVTATEELPDFDEKALEDL